MELYNLNTNRFEDVSPFKAVDALRSGAYTVKNDEVYNLRDSMGNLVGMRGENVFGAIDNGYSFAPPEMLEAEREEREYDDKNIQAAALGTLSGLSYGASNYLLTQLGLMDKEEINKIRKYNPNVYGISELGSAALGTIAGAAPGAALVKAGAKAGVKAGALAKTAKALSYTPTGAITKAALKVEGGLRNAMINRFGPTGIVGKSIVNSVPSGVVGAAEGLAWELGNFYSEKNLGNPKFNAESMVHHLSTGAGIGGLAGFVLPFGSNLIYRTAKAAAKKSPNLAVKGLSTAFGAPEEYIHKYLNDPDILDGVKDKDEIAQLLTERYDYLDSELRSLKITKEEAEQLYKENLELVTEKMGYIPRLHKESKARINNFVKEMGKELEDVNVDNLMISEVRRGVEQVENEIKDLTNQAYDSLSSAGIETAITKKDLIRIIDSNINSLRNKKTGAITQPQAKLAAKKLTEQKNAIKKAKGDYSPKDVKELVLDLDEISKGIVDYNKPYTSKAAKVLMRTRAQIDSAIKVIPEYREIMRELADRVSKISKWRKGLGSDVSIRSKLRYIYKDGLPDWKNEFNTLERFTNIPYGQMLADRASKYKTAKILKGYNADTLVKDIDNVDKETFLRIGKKYFPQDLENFQRTYNQLEIMKDGKHLGEKSERFKIFVNEKLRLVEDFELRAERDKISKLAEKIKADVDQMKRFKPFEEFDKSAATVQKELSSAESRQIRSIFKEISDLGYEKNGYKDFTAMVEKARLKYVFDRTFQRGSRNVNLWSVISGATLGGLTGGVNLWTLGLGAVAGAVIDKYGPKIALGILRNIARIKGNISPSKVFTASIAELPGMEATYKAEALASARKLEQLTAITARRIGSSVRDYVMLPAVSITVGIPSKVKSYEEYEEEIEERREVKDFMANDYDDFESMLAPMFPATKEALKKTMTDAIDFIEAKFPKRPLNDPFKSWKPNNQQMQSFNRYYQYAFNPLEIADAIEQGYIPKEGIETLKKVYPAMYQYYAEVVFDELSKNDNYNKLSDARKYQLYRAFGINPNNRFSPIKTAIYQGGRQRSPESQEKQQGQPVKKKTSKSGMNKVSLGERSQTRMNTIGTRV